MSAQDTNQAAFLEGYKAGHQSGFPAGFQMSMKAAIMINASPPAPNPLLSTVPPTAAPTQPTAAPKGPRSEKGLSKNARRKQRWRQQRNQGRIKADMPAPLAPKRQTEESKPAISAPRASKRRIEESDGDWSVAATKRRCFGGPAATTVVSTARSVPAAGGFTAASVILAARSVPAAPVVPSLVMRITNNGLVTREIAPVASTARLVPAAGGFTAAPVVLAARSVPAARGVAAAAVVPGPAMRTINNEPATRETVNGIEITGYMG
ncbi:uncharacterized protein LAJ45_07241 [Morchella importuna]|uniref:uncharacterized protein n=1 Tax=Morchella importuna TaxID=1174673 RepID=UPI001E8DF95D|nr:uncharacterized protein LAJ45_07241 [Morchella importuna]KAH8148530.1 hypothetical protein LAJ45_07241 [Morchella importuna]